MSGPEGRILDLPEENKGLKEKLAESEKRIRLLEDEEMTAFIIGDAVSDGICMVDAQGIVIRINRGYTEITGDFINIAEISLKEAVQDFEREILKRVLKEYGTSYAAAEVLKTTQSTIIRKAQALGIPLGRNRT